MPTADELDDDTLAEIAAQALKRPDNFMKFTDFGQYDTFAPVTSHAVNSDDLRSESNYYSFVKALRENPDVNDEDWRDVGERDWAFGPIDSLYVRVRDGNGQFTQAWREAVSIGLFLRDEYPVLDESDYSDRETVAFEKKLDEAYQDAARKFDDDDPVADYLKAGVYEAYREECDGFDEVDYHSVQGLYSDARDEFYRAAAEAYLEGQRQAAEAALRDAHTDQFPPIAFPMETGDGSA